MKTVWFAVMVALVGCGGAGPANVAACKSLISKLQCGSTAAPLTAATCDGYINTVCDYAPYFRCLEGAYVCTNGQYDSAKLSTVGSCTIPVSCP